MENNELDGQIEYIDIPTSPSASSQTFDVDNDPISLLLWHAQNKAELTKVTYYFPNKDGILSVVNVVGYVLNLLEKGFVMLCFHRTNPHSDDSQLVGVKTSFYYSDVISVESPIVSDAKTVIKINNILEDLVNLTSMDKKAFAESSQIVDKQYKDVIDMVYMIKPPVKQIVEEEVIQVDVIKPKISKSKLNKLKKKD